LSGRLPVETTYRRNLTGVQPRRLLERRRAALSAEESGLVLIVSTANI